MDNYGLTDSRATLTHTPNECPACRSAAWIGPGICLGCLLQTGADGGSSDADTLEAALDDIPIPDTNWRLGNYEILEEIGRGGMGIIYRARQRHSRRIVALKRLLSYHSDSRETLERFRREAEAAASLDHPNILPIYEVGESEEGVPYFSMKFAPGGSLQEVGPALRNQPREVIRLMAKVTRAVQHAHRQGILHRDLKPGNILLDGRGEPLVSDFGLAKWLDASSNLTRTLTIYGTPGYIAPEQAEGPAASLKPAADIYSLGAILFDLLAGRPPFLGEHALAVIRQAAERPAPKLCSLVKTADRDLETICARCLEQEPAARYHSAGDLAEDLERWLEGRPIVARPVAPPIRLWRWSRRNPKLAGSAAACFILSLVALTSGVISSRRGALIRDESAILHSLAVMPVEDLDEMNIESDSARELTESLRDRLAQTKEIKVASFQAKDTLSRDLSRPEEWRQAGRQLGVPYLLAATVRIHEGKPHAVLQLVEASSGLPVKRWLREGDSLAAIAATSTGSIAATINARAKKKKAAPTPGEIPELDYVAATNDRNARDYFVAARELRFRLNVPDFEKAIALFEKAVGADPGFAIAHAMLASAYQARSELDPSGPWLERGMREASLAIRLEPMLPEAHRALAGNYRYQGQLTKSLDSYLSAYELEPNDRSAGAVGNLVEQLGRPDVALCWLEKAVHLEPRPGIHSEFIGNAWTDLGRYGDAEAAYARSITFRPDLSGGHLGLARLDLFRRDFAAARKRCERARREFPADREPRIMAAEIEFFGRQYDKAEPLYRELLESEREGGVDFPGTVRFLSALGFIRCQRGDQNEGKALLKEAQEADLREIARAPDNVRRHYSLAADSALLGDRNAALKALNDAVAGGWIDFRSLQLDPRFDSLRDRSEFQQTLVHLTDKIDRMYTASARRNPEPEKLKSNNPYEH